MAVSSSSSSIEIIEEPIDVISITSSRTSHNETIDSPPRSQFDRHWTTTSSSAVDSDRCATTGFDAFVSACRRNRTAFSAVEQRAVWRRLLPKQRLAFHAEAFVGRQMIAEQQQRTLPVWTEQRVRQFFYKPNNKMHTE